MRPCLTRSKIFELTVLLIVALFITSSRPLCLENYSFRYEKTYFYEENLNTWFKKLQNFPPAAGQRKNWAFGPTFLYLFTRDVAGLGSFRGARSWKTVNLIPAHILALYPFPDRSLSGARTSSLRGLELLIRSNLGKNSGLFDSC